MAAKQDRPRGTRLAFLDDLRTAMVFLVVLYQSGAVYIIHMVVLGVLALPLVGTEIPSLWKYLILTPSTYAVSNALVFGYRRAKALAWSHQEAIR